MQGNSKAVIKDILVDLSTRNRDRNELMSYYVQKRLDKSVQTYYKQLLESRTTLSHLSNKRVVKNLIKQ